MLAAAQLAATWNATRGVTALTPDAMEYGLVARGLADHGRFSADLVVIHPGLVPEIRHAPEFHGLLQPFLTLPAAWALGPGADAVRAPALVGAAGLVLATYLLASRVAGSVAGLVAAVIVARNRDLLLWACLASDDVVWALASTLAAAFFLMAFEPGRGSWLLAAGVTSAIGALQKVTGVVLPLAFLLCWFTERRSGRPAPGRAVAALAGPVVLALGAHVARNVTSRGTPGFSFSGIDWLAKTGSGEYFAYYEVPPETGAVLARVGAARALASFAEQLGHVGHTLAASPLLGVLGPLAMLALATRTGAARFGRLALAHLGLVVGVVAVGYHAEPRYLASILPLSATALAAVAVSASAALRRDRAGLVARVAVAAVALAGLGFDLRALARDARAVASTSRLDTPCPRTTELLRERLADGESVIGSNPWWVAWETGRPAVMAPTNGPLALTAVARHYGTRWALAMAGMPGAGLLEQTLSTPSAASRALAPRRVLREPGCTLFRLDGLGRPPPARLLARPHGDGVRQRQREVPEPGAPEDPTRRAPATALELQAHAEVGVRHAARLVAAARGLGSAAHRRARLHGRGAARDDSGPVEAGEARRVRHRERALQLAPGAEDIPRRERERQPPVVLGDGSRRVLESGPDPGDEVRRAEVRRIPGHRICDGRRGRALPEGDAAPDRLTRGVEPEDQRHPFGLEGGPGVDRCRLGHVAHVELHDADPHLERLRHPEHPLFAGILPRAFAVVAAPWPAVLLDAPGAPQEENQSHAGGCDAQNHREGPSSSNATAFALRAGESAPTSRDPEIRRTVNGIASFCSAARHPERSQEQRGVSQFPGTRHDHPQSASRPGSVSAVVAPSGTHRWVMPAGPAAAGNGLASAHQSVHRSTGDTQKDRVSPSTNPSSTR